MNQNFNISPRANEQSNIKTATVLFSKTPFTVPIQLVLLLDSFQGQPHANYRGVYRLKYLH